MLPGSSAGMPPARVLGKKGQGPGCGDLLQPAVHGPLGGQIQAEGPVPGTLTDSPGDGLQAA